jgi:hypothetical protein
VATVDQVLEQQHQTTAARRLPKLIRSTIGEELLDPSAAQLGSGEPTGLHPPARCPSTFS